MTPAVWKHNSSKRGADSIERLKSLRRFAEDRLKPDLEAVEGSAAVKVSGGYEDEVQVFVDQQKLGVNTSKLAQALSIPVIASSNSGSALLNNP